MHASTSLVAMALLMAGQPANDATPPAGDIARVSHAVVSLIDFVQVPARQPGVLQLLELPDGTQIKEGVEVERGQLLGGLNDKDALARKRAAEAEHNVAIGEWEKSKLAIDAADRTVEVAQAEVDESEYVNSRSRGAVPTTQLRRQKLTVARAAAEAKVAKSDVNTAELTIQSRAAQMDVAEINHEMHSITAPIQGEIVNVYRQVGEWVNPGDPLLRIVRLDQLRVEGFLQLDEYRREEVKGQPVTVTVTLTGGRTAHFPGMISYVSPLIQANGDYRVWCEIDNRKVDGFWVMLPGMDAKMTIELKKVRQVASAR